MKITFQYQTFDPKAFGLVVSEDVEYARLGQFVLDWIDGHEEFIFQTSGSTGAPKEITIGRNQILASVAGTQRALGLASGDNVLICLSPAYIATMMMMARALILDLDVVILAPSSDPLARLDAKVDFASFVPFQVYTMIDSGSIDRIGCIRNTLIGGAPLHQAAQKHLSQYPNSNYMTYGMTETVSHVALMRIVPVLKESVYQVLEGIDFGIDNDCLWLQGEVTNHQRLQTNDMVEILGSRSFRWLGRKDNVINSGGVKINPEQIEPLIASFLKSIGIQSDIFLSGYPDDKLGQRLVLHIESDNSRDDLLPLISDALKQHVSRYHIPKEIRYLKTFRRTDNGKIKRIN